uniref:Uncharacterized protein n=1 Tax=Oryza nivara TaxID=4536 RepID=A0A0E0GSU0_ORYNI
MAYIIHWPPNPAKSSNQSDHVGGYAQQSTAQAQRKLASAWQPQAGKHDTARIKLLIAARIMHGDMLEYCQKLNICPHACGQWREKKQREKNDNVFSVLSVRLNGSSESHSVPDTPEASQIGAVCLATFWLLEAAPEMTVLPLAPPIR